MARKKIVFRARARARATATATSTLLAVISRCYLFSFHRMLKFCRTILFESTVFQNCFLFVGRLVDWPGGRATERKYISNTL